MITRQFTILNLLRYTHILFLAVAATMAVLFFYSATGYGMGTTDEVNGRHDLIEKSYKAAKDFYYQLESDHDLGLQRKNWLKGVRKFRKLYLEHTKGPLAPSALYMMGKMQYKMYQRFHLSIDLEDSIGYYNDVVTIFPENSLADDASYNAAEIYLNDKSNQKLAADQYLKIVQQFPTGDKYSQAFNRLQKLQKSGIIQIPAHLRHKQKENKLVNVLPVKYWSSDDYTRIVIRASSPVHYSSELLEETTGQPRRLYIDFNPSYIPPKYRSPVPIEDGLLKQIRTGQFTDSTVRVVLDIESISDYKIFSLNDPFRVVIDVHGNKKKTQPSEKTITAHKKKSVPTLPDFKNSKRMTIKAESTHPFISLQDHKKRKPTDKATAISSSSPTKYSLAQQLGLGVRKIVIDPGHGGKDPGAIAHGLKEKDIVLTISKKLANVLETTYGYEVSLTRTNDVFIPLEERTAIANTLKADLFISIHVNAHKDMSISGTETYFLNLATNAEAMRVAALENATSTHNIGEMQDILSSLMQNSKINESSRLAEYVHANLISGLVSNYPIRDLGVKQAPFYVLIGAEMPAVLAEIAFLSNPNEAKLLNSTHYQNKVAQHIAAGVVSYIDHHTTAALQL